jgi:MoaA/NifB/PqqE/SkfB family radical SAM enzyme
MTHSSGSNGRWTLRDRIRMGRLAWRHARESKRRGLFHWSSLQGHFGRETLRRAFGHQQSTGPEIAVFAITPRCPLDCWHCSEQGGGRTDLPPEVVTKAIDDLVGMGCSVIVFTGGDPFLSPHLTEYVEHVPPPHAALVFGTGYAVTDAVAAKLATRPNAAVLLSVDHLEAEVHDRLRGKVGSHAKALAAFELLGRHGVPRQVSTLVTHERIQSGEMERFLAEVGSWGAHVVQVFQPRPTGRLEGRLDTLLGSDDVEWMFDLAGRLGPDPRWPLLLNYPAVEDARLLGCCGGTYRIYIDSAGRVTPCDFCARPFGSLHEEPVGVIWRRMADTIRYPRAGCLSRDGWREDGPEGLRPATDEPAGIYLRYGEVGYRFFVRHIHFLSRFCREVEATLGPPKEKAP